MVMPTMEGKSTLSMLALRLLMPRRISYKTQL